MRVSRNVQRVDDSGAGNQPDGGEGPRLGALLRDLAPGVFCSLSHEVLPQIQEYERTSTTAINAYLGPAVGRYLQTMEQGLAALGCQGPLLVMQSNGGTMGVDTTVEKLKRCRLSVPVQLLRSYARLVGS